MAAALGLSNLFTEKLTAAPSMQKKSAPSDRVNLGVIGLGMGCSDLRGALTNNWAHCIAMCDVDQTRRNSQVATFRKDFPEQTKQLQEYGDFRKLLENKDIDGVIIAVPDHWHAYIFHEALQAGKAAYTEKPIANSIAECIPAHATNWLECIRTNNIQTVSPLEKGVFATILAHSANISFRTGTKVTYDAKTQKFVNNTAADAYLKPTYRKPWDSIWN